MDIFPWTTSPALELIGEAGLGYSFQSFTGQRNRYKAAIRDVVYVLLCKWLYVLTKRYPYVGNSFPSAGHLQIFFHTSITLEHLISVNGYYATTQSNWFDGSPRL